MLERARAITGFAKKKDPQLFPKNAVGMLAAATVRRSSGNWVAAASEASLSTFSGSIGTAKQATNPTHHTETDFQDTEPELLRITSLESEANTEALLRLFGRKPSQGKRVTSLPQVCEEETESLLRRGGGAFSVVTSRPAVPSLVPGSCSPDSGSDAEVALVSPRGSVDSASSPTDVEPEEVVSFRRTSTIKGGAACLASSAVSVELQAQPVARVSGAPDPTCAVDLVSWQRQSLQSILGVKQPEPEAEVGSTPQALLESSLLGLISDPVVKARIRSLQLFTDLEQRATTFVDCQPPAATAEGEEPLDGECEPPDSPPVLQRSFTAKRDCALEDCWLTGEQRRRKYSVVDEDELSCDGFKRRRS